MFSKLENVLFQFYNSIKKIEKKTFIDCIVLSLSMKEKKSKNRAKTCLLYQKKEKNLKKNLFAVCIIFLNQNNPPKFESKFYKMLGYHLYFSIIQAMTL